MIVKGAVAYTDDWKDLRTVCAACVMFRNPNACALVSGVISPMGHCDRFYAKTTDAWTEEAREAAAEARRNKAGRMKVAYARLARAEAWARKYNRGRKGASMNVPAGYGPAALGSEFTGDTWVDAVDIWKASEAKSHTKKANSPAKRKRWAKIANGILKKTGNEGRAIRIANAAMDSLFWDSGYFQEDDWETFMRDERRKRKVQYRDPSGREAGTAEEYEDAMALHRCTECNGQRFVAGAACPACSGKGFINEDEKMRRASLHTSSGSKDSRCRDYRKPFRDAKYDREFSGEQRAQAAEKGQAMEGGGYPIKNEGDLKNAIRAIGRAKNRAATVKHIKKRARALGLTKLIPEGWGDALPTSATLYFDAGFLYDIREMVHDQEEVEDQDEVEDQEEGMEDEKNCPECKGSGDCPECGGSGKVKDALQPRDGLVPVKLFDAVDTKDAKIHVTKDGYLTAEPCCARSGIQTYNGSECGRDDMETVSVYRPAEEVFSKDALRSFAHKPVTLDHPTEDVNSTNWKKHAVGHVGDEILRDGERFRVPIMLSDAAAVEAFKSGTKQLSWGYDCYLDWTPGVTPQGEKYDAVQRSLRANHLAVVTLARGGPQLVIGDAGR